MASDNPRPDRCGASVTDRVGLEVHDDAADSVYTTNGDLESVIIERGDVQEHEEPQYCDLVGHLKSGFDVTAVNLSRSEASDGDDEDATVQVNIEDDDPYVTHQETDLQGYCERYPMDSGRCWVHGGAAGAPEGNTNGMTHGLNAKRSNYYDQLGDEAKVFVERMAESWIDNAPFDTDNFAKVNEVYRLAVDQHRLWHAHEELDKGLITEQVVGQDEEGRPIEVDEENPANLAYDRLDRTTTSKLKDLGCLDDPDSQQAEATESLASKFEDIGS